MIYLLGFQLLVVLFFFIIYLWKGQKTVHKCMVYKDPKYAKESRHGIEVTFKPFTFTMFSKKNGRHVVRDFSWGK